MGPMGSRDWTNIAHTKLPGRPWDQHHETINGSLQYLVTEEIEAQDMFTDRQRDNQTTDKRVSLLSHNLDWSLTFRAKNVFIFTFSHKI